MSNKQVIDLSILTIIKFFLVVIVLFLLWFIKDVLAVLFVSLILSAAVDPWVDTMERWKFPRWLSILLIYVLFVTVAVAIVVLLIPPIVEQSNQLVNNFPNYFEKLTSLLRETKTFFEDHGVLEKLNQGIAGMQNSLPEYFQGVFSTVYGIFGGIVSFFLILVITFYMTVEESAMKRTLTYVLPDKYQPFTLQLINKVQRKIGDWLKGQMILSLILGVLSYIGLLVLGVNYALILALVAAFGEFVPYIGPIISAIPAVFIAFTQSPVKALFVLALYIVIQQIENHLLVPKIMQRAVGLNPIISIVALLVGAKIGGMIGIILAIPVATAISVILKEFWTTKEEHKI